jgi:hypothetical protein
LLHAATSGSGPRPTPSSTIPMSLPYPKKRLRAWSRA